MLPIEPRLKPLGPTIIHYADGDAKAKFSRCHSFSGYVPYFLDGEAELASANATAVPSSCSNETEVNGEASPPVWPDTDEEGDDPSSAYAAGPGPSSASESGDEVKSRLNSSWVGKLFLCQG